MSAKAIDIVKKIGWQEFIACTKKPTVADYAAHEAWIEEAFRKEEEKRRAEKALQDAEKIPSRFRGKSFDDFKVDSKIVVWAWEN